MSQSVPNIQINHQKQILELNNVYKGRLKKAPWNPFPKKSPMWNSQADGLKINERVFDSYFEFKKLYPWIYVFQTGGKAEAPWGGPLRKCKVGKDVHDMSRSQRTSMTCHVKEDIHDLPRQKGNSWLATLMGNDDLVRLCRRFQNKPTNEIF